MVPEISCTKEAPAERELYRMAKADLVTGFLGSGKTTFILGYVKFLKSRGEKVAVLENDLGAVNVDALLLEEVADENCEIETVAGGCDYDCHVRRFRTKLIAMGMQGYDRVIVEPSGVYDVEEFFDVLHEEPLDRWYEIGNVIAIMDIHITGSSLSREARYFIMSQAAEAGVLIVSHTRDADESERESVIPFLNGVMEEFGCDRRFDRSCVLEKEWDQLTEEDYEKILSGGHILSDHIKLPVENGHAFSTLYFMNLPMSLSEMEETASGLLRDRSLGEILRIKGFHYEDGSWHELNASGSGMTVKNCVAGQEVMIVIGEGLDREKIEKLICGVH